MFLLDGLGRRPVRPDGAVDRGDPLELVIAGAQTTSHADLAAVRHAARLAALDSEQSLVPVDDGGSTGFEDGALDEAVDRELPQHILGDRRTRIGVSAVGASVEGRRS